MQKISPFLWFDNSAEEATNYYVSIFKNSKVVDITRCGPAGPGPVGSVLTTTFELEGQSFMALNGGPHYKITPGISLLVDCQSQAEVDELWDDLSAGGQVQQCGWLTDKFGVSWQIIPSALGKLLNDPDPQKSARVMNAMLGMVKIDVAGLQSAYEAE